MVKHQSHRRRVWPEEVVNILMKRTGISPSMVERYGDSTAISCLE